MSETESVHRGGDSRAAHFELMHKFEKKITKIRQTWGLVALLIHYHHNKFQGLNPNTKIYKILAKTDFSEPREI